MTSNQSVIDRMLEAALRGGGLRAGEAAGTPSQPAPGGSVTSAIFWSHARDNAAADLVPPGSLSPRISARQRQRVA